MTTTTSTRTAYRGLAVGQYNGTGFVRGATTKQANFISALLNERVHDLPYTSGYEVNIRHASRIITHLLAQPKKPQAEAPVRTAAPRAAWVPVEAGIYLVNDTVVKVQKAVHGSGNMYAKKLDTTTGRFEYSPGLIRRVTADMRMTLDQAKQFGAIYGVCCNCGRTLTNEDSIEAGIGPVCAGKFI